MMATKKIVVLSAMSGTTNILVGIASKIQQGNVEDAQSEINDLYQKYVEVVDELLD